MYIKSIILDGFKSYGNRVEVKGFDPTFNAITGLNGTGKSNILDAICFVLGISNLSNVRAGSLTELIYKHGQAGITKATVSITFDNRDASQAPVGYENVDEITVTRQIVMGGKNKYLINGINVQNKRVSDLFCSVQLNVNNPHFLIMQGRITKVLNMKPPEILSMIEEAAGTSMYESKKVQALNTIAKKEAKLAELDDIIKEDIAPKLQKLQDERAQYQEHQQIVREIDGMSKLYKAYQYDCMEKEAAQLERQELELAEELSGGRARLADAERQCAALEGDLAALQRALQEESSGALQELEAALSAAEREEAAAAAALRAAEAGAAEAEAALRRARRALRDDQAALQDKRARADQAAESSSGLRAASEASAAALAAAQARLAEASAGGAGEAQARLEAARRAAAEAGSRAAAAALERAALAARLQPLRRDLAASAAAHATDQAALADCDVRRRNLQDELSALQCDEERLSALAAERRALRDAARAQRDAADALAARLQRCHFRYDPPQPDFEASRVHGTIARLIKVSEPRYCTAVETAAGAKLYTVVVDTEQTARLLLQRGNLRARVTLVPLSKIRGSAIDAETVAAAQEIGGGAEAVQPALSLVSGAAALAPALRWVWGGTLVCRDLATARRVCFHPRVRRRCVTLDGDVCEPGGTLSGGARDAAPSPLRQLAALEEAERALADTERALRALEAEHAALERAHERYRATRRRLELAAHEAQARAARLAGSTHARTLADVAALEAQVSEIESALQRDTAAQREAEALAAQLEATVEDIRGHREREFKKAEAALKEAKKAAEEHGAAWRGRAGELETLRLEAGELERGEAAARDALAEAERARGGAGERAERARAEHRAALGALSAARDALAARRARADERARALAERAARQDQLRAAADHERLRARELELSLERRREERAARASAAKALEAEEPWIAAEKQFFGLAGGAYDFEARAASGAAARLERLAARRSALARGLDARAHTLQLKEEEQYAELVHKKRIVEADRRKLQETMRSLDERKRSTLAAAAARVDRDFGNIFASLLPGAGARLAPPPGRAVLDGLEVRVSFNGVWKESLGELSGGQRSLVALALVLAMLRFKPAPLYILDEVDAALDLSHTQNIGAMLRDHFRTSQFIIVSLKDGMFNNANVLFRTRFQDGMSSVQRSAAPQPL